MRKVVFGITGAVVLLLAGILAWGHADATPLTGTISVHPRTNYSWVEKASCNAADQLCEKGKMLVCQKGTPDPNCKCEACTVGTPHARIRECGCPAQSCCNRSARSWKCCP